MPFALRRRIASLVDGVGVADRMLRLASAGLSPWLTVLTWHRVVDALDPDPDAGLVDGVADELDQQLGLLERYFRFVGVDDVRRWASGHALPPNPLLLTFDDGYREDLEVAMPVLRRHSARAVFFVATGYVTVRRPFWWDRVAYVMRRSSREHVALEYPHRVVLPPSEAGLRAALRLVKDTPGIELDRFLDALNAAADVPWSRETERSLADRLVMTWDDVRALRRSGMDVGSHTRTHRVLQTVPPKELDGELSGSRLDLERELDEPIRSMSYPNGDDAMGTPAIAETMRRAGYDVAFTNTGGINPRWARRDPLGLRRIPMDAGLTMSRFRAMLALPFLA